MAREPAGHTLQPTALVHEAWLRMAGHEAPRFENRAHFFAAAAEAMRRILVESARRKARLNRGGGWARVNLDDVQLATESGCAVHAGEFGADMKVALVNDGPVTILMDTKVRE